MRRSRCCARPVRRKRSTAGSLLALDFSPTSTRAVQMAGQLGFLDAASLTALHAFEPFAKGMMRYSGIKEDRVEHYVDQEELKANVELRDYVAGLGLGREDIQLRVGEGLPINVIMTEVRRQAPQLTVLGTQGLTGFRRALIGSVAEAASATCRATCWRCRPSATRRRAGFA